MLPGLGARPIRDVRKRDLVELIEKVALWHPIRANRTLAYLKRLFGWALDKELIEVNPAITIKKPAREVSRDRVLDDAELVAIWRAAEGMDAYGRLVRLLLVTGARLSEIADAKVDDLADDGTALRLPGGEPRTASAGSSTSQSRPRGAWRSAGRFSCIRHRSPAREQSK